MKLYGVWLSENKTVPPQAVVAAQSKREALDVFLKTKTGYFILDYRAKFLVFRLPDPLGQNADFVHVKHWTDK